MTKLLQDYNTQEPLECCEFKSLNRCLGVTVGLPFLHRSTGKQMIDLELETPSINTHTYGSCCPVEEARGRAAKSTRKVIDDLDVLIRELTEHRDRLRGELENLEDEAETREYWEETR